MANLWWFENAFIHNPLHSLYLLLFYQAEQDWKNPKFTWSVLFSFHIEISGELLELELAASPGVDTTICMCYTCKSAISLQANVISQENYW